MITIKAKFKIDIPFVFIFSLFFIADMLDVFLIALISGVCHEIGHLVAIFLVDGNIKKVTIKPFGINIERGSGEYCSYFKDILVHISGPIINLFLFFVSYVLIQLGAENNYLNYFCGINLLLFVINLIPVCILDGGKVLEAILLQVWDYTYAQIFLEIISLISSTFLMFCGIIIYYATGYNISLLLISIYLLAMTIKNIAYNKRFGIGYKKRKEVPL